MMFPGGSDKQISVIRSQGVIWPETSPPTPTIWTETDRQGCSLLWGMCMCVCVHVCVYTCVCVH